MNKLEENDQSGETLGTKLGSELRESAQSQPAQEPDADAEGWIDASKRMPEINQLVWHTSKYAEGYAEPALYRFLDGFYSYTTKWRPAHVTIPPAPRSETQDEIDRKKAEALWLKIPGDVGARKTDYIAGVLDGLKAERERGAR